MKVIIIMKDGQVEQVERYRDDDRTRQEYEDFIQEKEAGGISVGYSFQLWDVAVFNV